MRALHLSRKARDSYALLGATEREAVEAILFSLMDERQPLVGPTDHAVTHGAAVMGRPVPGSDLVLCYVPAGPEVHVVGLARR